MANLKSRKTLLPPSLKDLVPEATQYARASIDFNCYVDNAKNTWYPMVDTQVKKLDD